MRCVRGSALLGGLWCALLLGPRPAGASGFALAEQGAVAAGTGGAGVARDTDPAAAWYNPAALADGGGLRAQAGLLLVVPLINAVAADQSWSSDVSRDPRTPPHLYLGYGRGRWAGGVSVNLPFASGVSWPEAWPGRYEIVASSLQVLRSAPFVALRLGMLRLAAGVHLDVASLSVQRSLDFIDHDGGVAVDLAAVGLGGHAALLLRPWRQLSLGLTYKSRTALDLEGTARFNVPAAFGHKAHDQHATARITLPDLLTLGVSYSPWSRLTAVIDLGLCLWSTYDRLLIDFEDEATDDSEQVNEWSTTVSLRGGLSYRLRPWLALRAGGFYDPSPVPATQLAPNSPDSDRAGVSGGVGLKLPWGLSLDVSYVASFFLGRYSEAEDTLQAGYQGSLHSVGLGLSYGAGW